MTERRERPIFRCPDHFKARITHACVKKLIDRIIFNAIHIKPKKEA